MTAHKAKGLEWDVVVLPDLCDGVFPSTRGRSRWTTAGHCLPYPLRGDRASLPELGEWSPKGLGAFDVAVREQAAVEELRLAYVAMTRPRHRLIAAGHWWGPTQRRPRGPSEYLSAARAFTAATGQDPGGPWAARPGPGAENPCLSSGAEHSWPAPVDAAEAARRRAGAELVRAALREPAAFDAVPPNVAALSEAELQRVAAWDHDLNLLLRPRARAPRSRDTALPTTLTVSQVSLLATRPDVLARDLARPMPRPPRPAAARGSRFHAWLAARFGQQVLLNPEEVPGGAGDAVALRRCRVGRVAGGLRTQCIRRSGPASGGGAVRPAAGRARRPRAHRCRLSRLPTGYEVIDWKTSARESRRTRCNWACTDWPGPRSPRCRRPRVGAAFPLRALRSDDPTGPARPIGAELELLLTGGADVSGVAPTLPRPETHARLPAGRGASVDGPRDAGTSEGTSGHERRERLRGRGTDEELNRLTERQGAPAWSPVAASAQPGQGNPLPEAVRDGGDQRP